MMKKTKILSCVLALSLLCGMTAGCAGDSSDTPNGAIAVTDQLGREVTLEKPAERLVSSYYISTALLVALGCEDSLCGIEMKADTRELYRLAAPELLELPAVGSGKGINVEETAALSPDLVILPARLADSVSAFEALSIPVIVVNPETQADFEACVSLLASVTGTTTRGDSLLQYYHDKMKEAEEMTADLDRPSVYFSSSSGYLRTCTGQMYQSDLIEMAGGSCVSASLTEEYWCDISPEQLLAWNPSYIFTAQGTDDLPAEIRADSALAEVDAVKNDRIAMFPSKIESWDYPTPSSVLGVLWLVNQLHPEVYSEADFLKEAQEFYQTYFDISITEEDLGIQ